MFYLYQYIILFDKVIFQTSSVLLLSMTIIESGASKVEEKNIKVLMEGRSMIRYEISDLDESEIRGSEVIPASEPEDDQPENKRTKHSQDETESAPDRIDDINSGLPPELEVKFPGETDKMAGKQV